MTDEVVLTINSMEGGEFDGQVQLGIVSAADRERGMWVYLRREDTMRLIETLIAKAHLDDELSAYPPR